MIRKILNFLLIKYYAKKNKAIIRYCPRLSFRALKNIGINCRFLDDVSVSEYVQIGSYTSINGPGTRIEANINKIVIGNFCSIASGVVIQEYYHNYNRLSSYFINKNIFKENIKKDIVSKGSIIIEDDVWIGSNCIILSGITIGRGAIIGAGSVVTKDVSRYSIVAGNPAKPIKHRFNNETIEYIESLEWWNWEMKEILKNRELFNCNISNLNKH